MQAVINAGSHQCRQAIINAGRQSMQAVINAGNHQCRQSSMQAIINAGRQSMQAGNQCRQSIHFWEMNE
jgi:hypothetical protein